MTKKSLVTSQGFLLWLVALLSLLSGCLDTGMTEKRASNRFSVTISSSKKCAKPNEVLILSATVTNETGQKQIIELPDRPVFDIVIGNADEPNAIRWSNGKPLSEANRLELGPGESKAIEMDLTSMGTTTVSARFIQDGDSPAASLLTPVLVIPPYCLGIGP